MSPKKNNLRRPRGKYVSVSERTRRYGRWSRRTTTVIRVLRSIRTQVGTFTRIDKETRYVDKEIAESNKPTLALLPKRSEEEEINNNGETQDRDGKTNLRRSNRVLKPPERLGNVPYL